MESLTIHNHKKNSLPKKPLVTPILGKTLRGYYLDGFGGRY